MDGVIYMYTSPSGKMYIGKTIDPRRRKIEHARSNGKSPKLHNAIKKYGFENLKYEVLETGVLDKDELNLLEQYYIWYFMSYEHGYNCTNGGDGSDGESAKIRNRRLPDNPKWVESMKAVHEKNRTNQEYKDKLKIILTNRNKDPLFRVKVSEGGKRAKSSEVWKKKHSDRIKKIYESEDHRKKHRDSVIESLKRPEVILSRLNGLKKRMKPVICVETGQIFESVADASRITGVCQGNLSTACNHGGKRKGLTFEFYEGGNNEC